MLTGLILAGGKSSRFGSDKASALLAGKPLLCWVALALAGVCEALVVVRAKGQQLPPFEAGVPTTVVDDRYEAKGPLAGLVAGFAAVSDGLVFATSCDAPLLKPELVRFLAGAAPGHDVVIPHVDGFPQPLMAVYRPQACLPVFEGCVERDVLKITVAFKGLDVRVVREPEVRTVDPELRSFRNANRPEALEGIAALLLER